MKLYAIPAGPVETNGYLLTHPERGEALLIDAPEGIWGLIEARLQEDKCRLTELWITHGHWDHTLGAAEIVRKTGAKTTAHLADRAMFETPEIMRDFMDEDRALEPIAIDRWVEQGTRCTALGLEAEVRHVPGHCPGSVLFYFAAQRFAFVGDAIFRGSIGRVDLPGGSFEMLERSIREQIYTLPGDTTLHPGHGLCTTVEAERAGNPYVHD